MIDLVTSSPLALIATVVVGIVILFVVMRSLSSSSSSSSAAVSQSWRGANGKPIDPALRKRHNIVNGVEKCWTVAEVATHNSKQDILVIVQNKVYDLTDFIDDHPGGIDSVTRLAGLDNTEGFSGIQHPAKVWDMIEEYYCGDVVKEEHVVYTFKNVSKL